MEIFKYKNEIIEYELEKKRIRNCYISIKDGKVVVRVPLRISHEKIEELILKRADWILENVNDQKKKVKKAYQYVDGEIFKVLGKEVVLKVSYENKSKPKFKFSKNKFIVTLPAEDKENSSKIIKKMINDFYTKLAEKEIEKAMRKMSMKVGLVPNSYKIKNLKSTWGNCSTSANVSINKNVVKYSKHAIEYVCLHEICHLRNMNHSKDFWDMVEKYMPDYKVAEEELKG